MPRILLLFALFCLAAFPAQAGQRGCFTHSLTGADAASEAACVWKRVRVLDPAYGQVVWRRLRVCG